jgi:hypothetical protein
MLVCTPRFDGFVPENQTNKSVYISVSCSGFMYKPPRQGGESGGGCLPGRRMSAHSCITFPSSPFPPLSPLAPPALFLSVFLDQVSLTLPAWAVGPTRGSRFDPRIGSKPTRPRHSEDSTYHVQCPGSAPFAKSPGVAHKTAGNAYPDLAPQLRC